jgi:uncharacterized protein (DUF1015 family)
LKTLNKEVAKVSPFKAILPVKDKVHLVASRSYVSYTYKDLDSKLKENPFSFIHIINPEFGLSKKSKPNSIERFKAVKKKYNEFVDKGIFEKHDSLSYYIYRQTQPNACFEGLIVAVSVDDYISDKIKKHEATLSEREAVFKNYLDVCDFNAEPVLLTHEFNNNLDSIIKQETAATPYFDFTTTDCIRHTFWAVNNAQDIQAITQIYSKIESFYIADGHHRSASSALLGIERKNRNAKHTGTEAYNFFMAYLIPENQLKIHPFHRLINIDTKLNEQEIFQALLKDFTIKKTDDAFPQKAHQIGFHAASGNYLLEMKNVLPNQSAVKQLDTYLLSEMILEPVFGISDLKTDKRVSFVGGAEANKKLLEMLKQKKCDYAFSLFPVEVNQMKAVADAGEIMPPKSTWIEPKLRSGFCIYQIDEK